MRNGHIKRITDDDIASSVLEVVSANVSTTYISCPSDPQKTLGIKLPFLVMIIKNLKKYFSFEVQVLDDKNVRRRFRASNYQVNLLSAHLQFAVCVPLFGLPDTTRRLRSPALKEPCPALRHDTLLGPPRPVSSIRHVWLRGFAHFSRPECAQRRAVDHACEAVHLHHAHAAG